MENFEERLKNFYKAILILTEKYPECKEDVFKILKELHLENYPLCSYEDLISLPLSSIKSSYNISVEIVEKYFDPVKMFDEIPIWDNFSSFVEDLYIKKLIEKG